MKYLILILAVSGCKFMQEPAGPTPCERRLTICELNVKICEEANK